MIKGKSLTELAQEIERQRDSARDFVVNTKVLEMDPTGHLAAGSHNFGIRETAHGQISDFTKIPKKYYDRMRQEDPGLLATNVNSWFKRGEAPRMIRTLDGHARAFLSDKYRRVDNWQIAEATLPVLAEMPGLKIMSSEITERRMYLFAATDRIQGDVKVGDTVQMGVRISNSEVGCGMISVSPTILRLKCSNGLTIDEGAMKTRHLGGSQSGKEDALQEIFSSETKTAMDRALMLKIRDLVKNAMSESFFQDQLTRMKDATVLDIRGDPISVCQETTKLLDLSQTEGTGLLKFLCSGGDMTKWGLVNAVTALANEHHDYDRATEIMELGNDVLSLDPKAWAKLSAAGAA